MAREHPNRNLHLPCPPSSPKLGDAMLEDHFTEPPPPFEISGSAPEADSQLGESVGQLMLGAQCMTYDC